MNELYKNEDIYNKAKDYAFNLLSYRPRTRHEIKGRLKEKKYSQEIIERVIAMLEEYNYINDYEFASLWIQNRCSVRPLGKWRLKQELLLKGIDEKIIEEQLQTVDEEKEYEMAVGLIRNKKKFQGAKREKIYNFLRRRGFSKEIVNRIIAQYREEYPENPYE